MELFVRIAAFDAGQRCFGKRGFDLHDLGGFGLGRVRFVSEQLEHLRNVGDVLVADGNGPVVALGVIVAVGQAEAAGFGESDHFCEFSKSWLEPKSKNRPLVRSEVCKRANSAGRSFVDCMAAI